MAAIGPRDGDGGGRWDTSLQEVDESREKLESVKVALVSAAVGSATLLPLLFFRYLLYSPRIAPSRATRSRLSPVCLSVCLLLRREDAEWQVKHVGLALSCVLFGITYRYAVRRDGNPNLKQGVVGAFSVTRALAAVTAPAESCSADLPLDCGPPFRLFTWTMLGQGVQALLESAAVLGLCALLLDALFALGWLSRFPTTATMTNNNTNSSKNNGRPS